MNEDPQDLRRQLKEAHMSPALVYAAIYDELCARFDAEVAEEVMKAAIYRRGLAIGQRFADYGPRTSRVSATRSSTSCQTRDGCFSRR
jgi:hypothetical protein